jgi:hypothetical protein
MNRNKTFWHIPYDGIEDYIFNITLIVIIIESLFVVYFYFIQNTISTNDVNKNTHIVCYPLDITGWKPLTRIMREEIGAGSVKQSIEIREFDSLDCVERDPNSKRIGEVIETRRMEWWRITPKHKPNKRKGGDL